MYQKIPEHVSCGIAPVLFQETFILNIFIISMSTELQCRMCFLKGTDIAIHGCEMD